MPRVALSGQVFALGALLLLLGAASSAGAVRPTAVRVQAHVPLDEEGRGTARDRALERAIAQAVLQVARTELDRPLDPDERRSLRDALEEGAASAVLTYRVESQGSQPDPADPSTRVYSVRLAATVDAEQVRARLAEAGWLAAPRDRPSVVLVARASGAVAPEHALSPARLESFEEALTARLEREGFVVVEPALRAPGTVEPRGVLELARAVGADVAADIALHWTPRLSGAQTLGGSLEVAVRAYRTADRFELAASRFDAPAYHPRPEEAQARAIEAIESQVGDNLVLQLERNWRALAPEAGPVQVVLQEVGGLAQVESVRAALLERLGASEATLDRLGPRSAELLVRASYSPGALGDRLAAFTFEGFRLEPRSIGARRVDLRVVSTTGEPPVSSR